MSQRAVYFDRDGILNRVVTRGEKVTAPWCISEFEILPSAKPLVETAKSLGFLPIVATNQPDIAHGRLKEEDLAKMHEVLRTELGLELIEVCTSADNSDPRRKPNPGMLLDAEAKYGIDKQGSFFIGDSLKDIQAGKRAGIKTILLETDYNQNIHGTADVNCRSHEAIAIFLKEQRQ